MIVRRHQNIRKTFVYLCECKHRQFLTKFKHLPPPKVRVNWVLISLVTVTRLHLLGTNLATVLHKVRVIDTSEVEVNIPDLDFISDHWPVFLIHLTNVKRTLNIKHPIPNLHLTKLELLIIIFSQILYSPQHLYSNALPKRLEIIINLRSKHRVQFA